MVQTAPTQMLSVCTAWKATSKSVSQTLKNSVKTVALSCDVFIWHKEQTREVLNPELQIRQNTLKGRTEGLAVAQRYLIA